jgi:hypothetical protein
MITVGGRAHLIFHVSGVALSRARRGRHALWWGRRRDRVVVEGGSVDFELGMGGCRDVTVAITDEGGWREHHLNHERQTGSEEEEETVASMPIQIRVGGDKHVIDSSVGRSFHVAKQTNTHGVGIGDTQRASAFPINELFITPSIQDKHVL